MYTYPGVMITFSISLMLATITAETPLPTIKNITADSAWVAQVKQPRKIMDKPNIYLDLGQVAAPDMEGFHVYQGTRVWVVTNDSKHLGRASNDIRESLHAFENCFNVVPEDGCIVLADKITPAQLVEINKLNGGWFLLAPWYIMRMGPPDKVDPRNLGEFGASIREELDKNGKPTGVVLSSTVPIPAGSFKNTLSRHELGHKLFSRYVLRNESFDGYSHPCPDWLEEIAAIVCERAPTNGAWLNSEEAFRSGKMPKLSEFLTMPHPSVLGKGVASADLNKGGTTQRDKDQKNGIAVSSTTVAISGEAAERSSLYYSQCRLFAGYLWLKTGNKQIFAEIASAVKDGAPLDVWLAGNTYGLPKTVNELENAWSKWVEERYENRKAAKSAE